MPFKSSVSGLVGTMICERMNLLFRFFLAHMRSWPRASIHVGPFIPLVKQMMKKHIVAKYTPTMAAWFPRCRVCM